MYLLYTDEANIRPEGSDFFVYAGIAIPEKYAQPLTTEIDRARRSFGYKDADLLKFNTIERPSHVTAEAHREIKKQIMALVASHHVKLFASFILHKIATSPEDARQNEINRICYNFNSYLSWPEINDVGLVFIDPFSDSLRNRLIAILREKFSVGIIGLPYTPIKRLDRILGCHIAPIGTSHFCSCVDIVLGSLRYAVNSRKDEHKQETALVLLSQIAPLCIRNTPVGPVHEVSIFYSPKTIRAPSYLDEYTELKDFLAKGGISTSQVPSRY